MFGLCKIPIDSIGGSADIELGIRANNIIVIFRTPHSRGTIVSDCYFELLFRVISNFRENSRIPGRFAQCAPARVYSARTAGRYGKLNFHPTATAARRIAATLSSAIRDTRFHRRMGASGRVAGLVVETTKTAPRIIHRFFFNRSYAVIRTARPRKFNIGNRTNAPGRGRDVTAINETDTGKRNTVFRLHS